MSNNGDIDFALFFIILALLIILRFMFWKI